MKTEDAEKRREYNQRYYERNKEVLKEKQRERNSKSRDRIRVYNQKYVAENAEKKKAYMAEYGRKNRPRLRAYMRLYRYGVTPEQYEQMLADQGGVCGICKRASEKQWGLVVDHNHQTGRVRGLLCDTCNVAIGLLDEDAARLSMALEWIK